MVADEWCVYVWRGKTEAVGECVPVPLCHHTPTQTSLESNLGPFSAIITLNIGATQSTVFL